MTMGRAGRRSDELPAHTPQAKQHEADGMALKMAIPIG